MKWLLVSVLVAATAGNSVAQPAGEFGRPYFRNFSSSEYDAHVWNSSAIQDERGVLYVGNNDGLLEYDGVSWRLIVLPGRSHVGSLGRDADGRIWVGGFGDLGFVAPDNRGRTTFVSILHNVPPDERGFTAVRRAIPTEQGVYFAVRNTVFRYRPDPSGPANGQIDIVREGSEGIDIFEVDGEILIWQAGSGLSRVRGGEVEAIPGGSWFADRRVRFVLSRDDGSMLVGTGSSGLYVMTGERTVRFESDANEALTRYRLSSGVALSGDRYAVGTSTGGVLVIGGDGHVQYRIDESVDLQHNSVQALYADRSGSLWVMLEKGVTRIDVESPMSLFGGALGLVDVALRVRRHDGRLYVGTTSGMSVLDPGSGTFRDVPEIRSRVDWLHETGEDLLAATASGLYVIRRGLVEAVPLSMAGDNGAYLVTGSPADPRVAFVSSEHGIDLILRNGGKWRNAGRLPAVTGSVRSGVGLSNGTVWITDENGWAYRIRPHTSPVTGPSDLDVRAFEPGTGLPATGASAYEVGDVPYFTAFGGLVFGLDGSGDRFVRVTLFDDLRTGYPLDWFGLHEDLLGRVWTPLGNRGMSMAEPVEGGGYRANPGPLRRLGSVLIMETLPEPDGVVWMAGSDGLIRYDTNRSLAAPESLSVLVRRVVARDDSLLYAGLGPPPELEIAYDRHAIRIEYALPSLKGASEYRTLLEGFDEDWSPWSPETDRVFTNLAESDYVFRVKARDIDGAESKETHLPFTVRPPWQRTIWAYLTYVLLVIALVWLLRRYEMSRLVLKYRLELQRIESERLMDLDRVRTDFFANISHEFRTPLTLILGPVADALASGRELSREQLAVLQRNGSRLLRLINQILDLSKLEAGGLTLRPSLEDIVPFVSGLLYSFESVAERRRIRLTFSTTRRSLPVLFERDRLEQVFLNLFSNALKFTPDDGSITVTCEGPVDGQAVVSVTDTGVGIPPDRVDHIFDRYFQSGVSPALEREGTGIGLALTKAIIELHGGHIGVESELGTGTTFTVSLPVGEGDGTETVEDEASSHDGGPGTDRRDEHPVGSENDVADGDDQGEPDPDDGRPIILVVEDHPDVRSYVTSCLAADYRIRTAVNGSDGLDRARDLVPDLIIADVAMPKMNGYDLARAIRADERTSHIPVIMLTARAAESDKLKGLEIGVDDYLLKPFNPQELRLRVRNLMAQREAARRRFARATIIKPADVAASSIDQVFLERVVACVESHIPDEEFTVDGLADEVGMSVSQLNRKLNALIDQPAGSLLRSMRLQRAADLLVQRAGTVSEIAYRVGYSNPTHFSTAFKKQFDVSPSAYRKGE